LPRSKKEKKKMRQRKIEPVIYGDAARASE
jgi:hypothetical protein